MYIFIINVLKNTLRFLFVVNREDTSIKVIMLLLPVLLFVIIVRQAVYFTLSKHRTDLEQMKYRHNVKPHTTLRSSQHDRFNAL